MIKLIHSANRHRYSGLIDQMFELRCRMFAERLSWDVEVHDGKETDSFDRLNPLYILALSEAGQVIGCLRLLQTTGPTMLQTAVNCECRV